jgi:hypothetical protein
MSGQLNRETNQMNAAFTTKRGTELADSKPGTRAWLKLHPGRRRERVVAIAAPNGQTAWVRERSELL